MSRVRGPRKAQADYRGKPNHDRRSTYRPRYNVPEPGVFANPVPSRPVGPVEARRVYDLLATFAEQLELEADAHNIAAARVRKLLATSSPEGA